jgi:hypothetical protein
LIELIRGAVLWVIWLERNIICLQERNCRSIQSIGMRIIGLASSWCKSRNANMFLKLNLVFPQDEKSLHLQDSPLMMDLVAMAEMVNHGSGRETDFVASLHADPHDDHHG